MAGAPVAISRKARVKVMRNKLVVIVHEPGFDLSRDAVPVSINVGCGRLLRNPGAPKIALADVAGEGLDIAGRG